MNPALGDFLLDSRPGFACGKTDDSGIFQFRMHNVSKASGISLETRRRIPRDAHRKLDQFAVTPGDILFNATNSPENTGKSILIPELDEPAVYSNHFVRLRTNPQELRPEYLWRFLQWHYQSGTFRGMIRTWVNQASVSKADLLALPLDPPTLHSQRRIASILDEADAIRAKRRSQLTLINELPQAVFESRFGLAAHDSTVGDVASIQGGLQVSSKRESLPDKASYLRVANVHRGRLDLREIKSIGLTKPEWERTRLKRGDLLFVEGHANPNEVGRVALWEGGIEDCVHQNHLIRARVDRSVAHPVFLEAWLNSSRGREHFRRAGKTTSGLNTISARTVRSAPIPLPPLGIQEEFAELVAAIHAERDRVAKALEVDEELFAALQHRAFRGEL